MQTSLLLQPRLDRTHSPRTRSTRWLCRSPGERIRTTAFARQRGDKFLLVWCLESYEVTGQKLSHCDPHFCSFGVFFMTTLTCPVFILLSFYICFYLIWPGLILFYLSLFVRVCTCYELPCFPFCCAVHYSFLLYSSLLCVLRLRFPSSFPPVYIHFLTQLPLNVALQCLDRTNTQVMPFWRVLAASFATPLSPLARAKSKPPGPSSFQDLGNKVQDGHFLRPCVWQAWYYHGDLIRPLAFVM